MMKQPDIDELTASENSEEGTQPSQSQAQGEGSSASGDTDDEKAKMREAGLLTPKSDDGDGDFALLAKERALAMGAKGSRGTLL